MADDRMKNDDDLQRNMGKAGEGQNYGQQTPGRGGQQGQQHGGQHTGGQKGGQGGYGGSQQNEPRNLDEEDEFGGGNAGQSGRGGQGRGGQNR